MSSDDASKDICLGPKIRLVFFRRRFIILCFCSVWYSRFLSQGKANICSWAGKKHLLTCMSVHNLRKFIQFSSADKFKFSEFSSLEFFCLTNLFCSVGSRPKKTIFSVFATFERGKAQKRRTWKEIRAKKIPIHFDDVKAFRTCLMNVPTRDKSIIKTFCNRRC